MSGKMFTCFERIPACEQQTDKVEKQVNGQTERLWLIQCAALWCAVKKKKDITAAKYKAIQPVLQMAL